MDIKSRDILAKTLYFEGGSTQGLFDIIFVAWVIRNRMKAQTWMGKTYIEVCLKKYQFSCWNGKTLEEIEAIEMNGSFRWRKCLMVAEYVMEEPEKENPFPGELSHYCNPMLVSPKWARNMKMVSPNLRLDHIFLMEDN